MPLPSILKTVHDINCIPGDEPALHEGRVRSFPHERGNWSTYVYIPFVVTPSVDSFVDVVLVRLASIVEIKPVLDFHISLSRTVVLRHHWIDLFVKSVEENFKYFPRFQISFGSVKIYCNEERTRTFVGLEVSEGLDALKKSIGIVDKCLAEFKLPLYYKDPSFHLSIAWTVGDTEKKMLKLLPQLDNNFKQCVFANSMQWTFGVSQLMCKTGNKLYSFPLQK